MSDYQDNLNNTFSMCPCSNPKDIPEGPHEVKQGDDENEAVENGFEVLSGDSGSEEEQDALAAQGYVPLAQNEDEVPTPNESEVPQEAPVVTSEHVVTAPSQPAQPGVEPEQPTSEAMASSSFAFSSTRESQMGEDEIDLIKSIMMNVKLPSSSIPEWAKRIPEERWKAPLVSSLQEKNTSKGKPTDKEPS